MQLSVVKSMIVMSVVALGATSSAQAATGSIALIDATGLKYFINDDITFNTTSSASGAISEASYTHAVAATTVAGATTSSTLNDLADGYGEVLVRDGVSLGDAVDTRPGTGDPAFTPYANNGAATMELEECVGDTASPVCSMRQAIFAPQTIGNLTVYRKVYVPTNDNFIRWVTFVTNNAAEERVVTLSAGNNLGSDSNTKIVTSSGDRGGTLSPLTSTATLWVVTMQDYSGTTSSDPRVGHVLQGPTSRVRLAYVKFTDGDDNPYWSYMFALAPGETRAILSFAVGSPSKWEAAAQASRLTYLPATALQGLTAAELDEIVNFDTSCAGLGDQCHSVVHNAVTGHCDVTPLTGTTCNDGDACTVVDQCNDGVCGGVAKDCSGSDSACAVGMCNPTNGACEAKALADATICDDSNDCTTDDVCTTGVCIGSNVADTTACNDGNDCTTGDVCTSGVCSGSNVADTTACDDGNFYTSNDVCTAGVCAGTELADGEACGAGTTCNDGVYAAHKCYAVPNNSLSCADADLCTIDSCSAGSCASVAKSCAAQTSACTTGSCDHATGNCIALAANEGVSCNDDDPCTEADACLAGVCVGAAKSCLALDDSCHTGACDATGSCAAVTLMDGTLCDDNDACTEAAQCTAGICAGVAKDCSAVADACNTAGCDKVLGCVAVPVADGTICNDGDSKTSGDKCTQGVCAGKKKSSGCNAAGDPSSLAAIGLLFTGLASWRRRRRLGFK
jgi:uncharacterized protein (TIGR03382 family)